MVLLTWIAEVADEPLVLEPTDRRMEWETNSWALGAAAKDRSSLSVAEVVAAFERTAAARHARAVIRLIRQVEHTPHSDTDGSQPPGQVSTPHVNTDYVERIRKTEWLIRNLLIEHGEHHSSVIEARFALAELTGESGDSRGAADQYESLGEDCKRLFKPADSRALNAFDAMARWIAAPS
ncbi:MULTISPECIES: hypothetical protein [unclassified Streptomyces]|uniref:hypothetical protein n=1 Tax=unclassified Streptomyces TaxID=2593676 RepID=UPI00341C706A